MTTPMSRARSRLESAYLYLVTPAETQAGPLDEFLPRVLEAGVDVVQLREKQMEAGPLLGHAEVVRRRTEEFGALFIVNDRVDVAGAAGADGVHLGQNDLPLEEARRQAGKDFILGLSTHAESEVIAAGDSEADYIAVGPVFETPTKPGRAAAGVDLVRFAAQHSKRPFFAIGGIDLSTLSEVIAAGASRVAVVRALTEADDPAGVARLMASALGQARR